LSFATHLLKMPHLLKMMREGPVTVLANISRSTRDQRL